MLSTRKLLFFKKRLLVQDEEEANAPLEQEQDKIAFIFNNLSLMNLKQKADDLR